MRNEIRILSVKNEDGMIGLRYQWKDAFDQQAPLAVLAQALEDLGLTVYLTEDAVSVAVGDKEPCAVLACVMDSAWAEAPCAMLYTACRILQRRTLQMDGSMQFVFARNKESVPKDAILFGMDENSLGTAVLCEPLLSAWQACYRGGGTATKEKTVTLGVRRDSNYATEYDLPEHRLCTDGAMTFGLGLILSYVLKEEA